MKMPRLPSWAEISDRASAEWRQCGPGRCLGLFLWVLRKNAMPIFLISGTAAVVVSKVMYDMEGQGLDRGKSSSSSSSSDGGDVHKFMKPWFTDWAMFVGMVLCLIPYSLEMLYKKHKKIPYKIDKRIYFYIIIPSLCDLISTYMMNVGLLWIPGSIWQMLRGSIVVFTAVLAVVYRKKRLYQSGVMGVYIVMVSLIVVGASTFFTPPPYESSSEINDSEDNVSVGGEVWRYAVGITLVIAAQFLQAVQTIIEEKLLHDVEAPATLVVGMEGVWGFVFCTFVAMPIAQFLPGKEGDGIHEDSIDTIVMLYHTPALLGMAVLYVFSILLFNIYGMIITEVTSAMVRNLLEPMRTMFIWITDLFIFYVISKKFGEEANWFSFMELGGFVLMCLGFFIYNSIIKFPFCDYPPPDEGKGKKEKKTLAGTPPGSDETSPLLGDTTYTVQYPPYEATGDPESIRTDDT